MSEEKWVLLLTVQNEMEANFRKDYLQDNGIECIIEPVAFRAYPSAGHFNLNVRPQEIKKAKQILSQLKK